MFGDYVHNSVEAEDPLGLVCLLYAKAIERIASAREHLTAGRIRERSEALAHASQIIVELQTSLDAERGGEIAVNLARLYDYIQDQLVEANAKQSLEALETSLQLLETLHEGWRECYAQRPTSRSGWSSPEAADLVGVTAVPARAWTL
jgi:flagellar secretion chaperone FliS